MTDQAQLPVQGKLPSSSASIIHWERNDQHRGVLRLGRPASALLLALIGVIFGRFGSLFGLGRTKQTARTALRWDVNMSSGLSLHGTTLVGFLVVVLSLVSLIPVAVDRVQLNTASLSRELQTWRARGQYYVHTK